MRQKIGAKNSGKKRNFIFSKRTKSYVIVSNYSLFLFAILSSLGIIILTLIAYVLIFTDYEAIRANDYLDQLKEKSKKIGTVLVRISPIMEILTGIMIAILIFYSGKLIANDELSVNNFFSLLAAMMLAYQPVRSLSTLNIIFNQGLSAAGRILPVIDTK